MSCSFVSFYFNDENQNFDILVPLEWFETREFFVEILKSSFGDLFLELTNIEITDKPQWLIILYDLEEAELSLKWWI